MSNEFAGFKDAECFNCGEKVSVHMEGWIVEVRDDVVMRLTLNPPVFVCEKCHAVNTVKLHLTTDVYTKQEEKRENRKP